MKNRTSGGSTGGSAGLVALGLGNICLGNDLEGSLRIPAHYNGLFSFKPTAGRIKNDL